jgi:hypothetical protein
VFPHPGVPGEIGRIEKLPQPAIGNFVMAITAARAARVSYRPVKFEWR